MIRIEQLLNKLKLALIAPLFIFTLTQCANKPATRPHSTRDGQISESPQAVKRDCTKGDPRSCVDEFEHNMQIGNKKLANKLYQAICHMPRIRCLEISAQNALKDPIDSDLDEILYSQDIWHQGILAHKLVIVYRDLVIAPD